MRSLLILAAFSILPFSTAHAVDWKNLGRPVDDDTKTMRDRYVYFDESTTDKNIPVDKPVLIAPEIQEWLSHRIAEVMKLDNSRYEQQVTVNRRHFTPKGYGEYVAALENAKIRSVLKERGYGLSAIVLNPPRLLANGLRDEGGDKNAPGYKQKLVYVWQLEAPVLLNYRTAEGPVNYTVYLQAELLRIPMQTDNAGTLVAINGWTFSAKPRQSTP